MTQPKNTTTGRWEEPPPKRQSPYDWAKIADRLRKEPGRWRKIYDFDRTSYVVAIRQGGIKALRPEDGFEVRTANNTKTEPRHCTLFLRYVDKEGT